MQEATGATKRIDTGFVGDAEVTLRRRVITGDGILLVYDAANPAFRPRAEAGYVAYWHDFEFRQLFFYDRLLYDAGDVGQALIDLRRDLGIDGKAQFGGNASLRAAMADAGVSPPDGGEWFLVTYADLRELMGFPRPEKGQGGEADILAQAPGHGGPPRSCRYSIGGGHGAVVLQAPPPDVTAEEMYATVLAVSDCDDDGGEGGDGGNDNGDNDNDCPGPCCGDPCCGDPNGTAVARGSSASGHGACAAGRSWERGSCIRG